MARPALEVAEIFRDHGAAWREANRGRVSLGQLKVMSAIESCRTAALGGYVARCENAACGHTVIAYCSCLMGKIGNGESKDTLRSTTEKFALSCSPLRVGPEHGHQFVRWSECPFTQVWWNDGLDRLELLAWIATRVDFGSGQLAVSEPEGYLSNILRRL
jgi:hypothetical protein